MSHLAIQIMRFLLCLTVFFFYIFFYIFFFIFFAFALAFIVFSFCCSLLSLCKFFVCVGRRYIPHEWTTEHSILKRFRLYFIDMSFLFSLTRITERPLSATHLQTCQTFQFICTYNHIFTICIFTAS